MVVGACAAHATTSGRVGRGGDGVAVELKVSHEVACTSYGEAVVSIGGYCIAILSPVDEVVACAGSSGKGSGSAIVIGAVAGNRTTIAWVGRSSDGVGVELEVGHEVTCSGYDEAVGSLGGYFLIAILCPVDEVVACAGCSGKGSGSSMVVGACTGNGTTGSRIGRGGDGVAVHFEVGHESVCTGYGEAVAGIRGYHLVVLRPVGEAVAGIGRSRQSGRSTIVIGACTGNVTTIGRVSRGGDFVGVDFKVGHEVTCSGYGETVAGIGGYLIAILRPVDEVVAGGGCGVKCSGSTMVIGACTAHDTAIGRAGRGSDFVSVELEVSHQGAVAVHCEAVAGVGRHLCAVLRPVGEVIAFVSCGSKGSSCAVVVGACAGNRTTCGRAGRSGDGVAVKCGEIICFTPIGGLVAANTLYLYSISGSTI